MQLPRDEIECSAKKEHCQKHARIKYNIQKCAIGKTCATAPPRTVQSSYDAPSTLKILTKEDAEDEQRQQQDGPTQGVRWVNPPVWGDEPMCGTLWDSRS